MKYKAYIVEENEGCYNGSIKELDSPTIDEGKVLIKVLNSSLNYKDALAATGAKGVVRSYPFVPGIDVAGKVLESSSSNFHVGDDVLATGYKIGMSEFGGFGEIVHLPENWVLKLPENLSHHKAMSYGTAGITAAACVKKILDADIDSNLPMVVSGATGGVGSIAVGLLSKLGYEVHAITGKTSETEVLRAMGANKIISRDDYMSEPIKPIINTVVMSSAVHAYVSQSDKGELVIGAGTDSYNSFTQRGGFNIIEETIRAMVELYPVFGKMKMLRQWGGIVDICPDASPIISKCDVEGLFFNCGWGTGGFKATPGSANVFAHTIAKNEPHQINAAFNLDRFASGKLVDEHGAAAVAH